MLPATKAFIERLHRPDSPVRKIVVAQVVERNNDLTVPHGTDLRASVRQRRDDWGLADGAAGGPPPTLTGFSLMENGDVRLAGIGATIVTKAGPPTNYVTDLNRLAPFSAIALYWGGTEATDLEIRRVKIHLNPRVSGAQTRQVVKWRLEMYALTKEVGALPHNLLEVMKLGDHVDVDVVSDVEGLVTFDYGTLTNVARPKPKFVWPLPGAPLFSSSQQFPHPTTFLLVTALDASGNGAANAGFGYAAGDVTTAGTTLSSRTLLGSNLLDFADGGVGPGCPIVTIDTETYSDATLAFTTNPLNMGGAPTADVQLIGRGLVPIDPKDDPTPRCAIIYEIRNDADSAWVSYTDGQFMQADLGLTPTQSRKFRATLKTNVASSLTPTLQGVGMEALSREIIFARQTRVAAGAWSMK
jgi:hypothetical protein